MGGKVIEVHTQADYDRVIREAGAKLVVIDFFATWCGPCKMVAPKIDTLSTEHENVVFIKIDVDDEEIAALVQSFAVRAMPTFAFVKGGEKIDEQVGANFSAIVEKVKKHSA